MYEGEELEKINPKWHSNVKTGSKMTLVVMDMQKLFVTEKKSPWSDSKLLSIIPNIKKLIKIIGAKNVIFSRFIPPTNWQDSIGSWRTFYRLNKGITRKNIGTDALDVVDQLQSYLTNNKTIADRNRASSIFSAGGFKSKIKKNESKYLIFVGIETDYCVLASALDAMNRGYYVIIVSDGCGSTTKRGHQNALCIFKRFPEQLWITSTDNLIKHLKSKK